MLQHTNADYRRDIDGLRSLAVLSVLFFHTHTPGFSGGYVGVDIFFVISGFLITGILVRDMNQGRFSLVRFYERRARRILPALLVMIAVVYVAAAFFYLPGDFEGVPRSGLITLLFLSNFWFIFKTGYFAGGSETMPLLHCWSLAVEEQFYIGFPLLLWLLARYCPPHYRNPGVAAVALISFIWAWLTQADGDGIAFYMLPPRAWELFTGALLALGVVPEFRAGLIRQLAAFAGLGAIITSIYFYNHNTLFPGTSALLPVMGAALLIHCAPGTLVGRALSLRLPVAIGIISYSLYLWHWPLIVFVEYVQDISLAGWTRVAVIAVTFILAWASWRFVEQPFRNPARFDRRQIFLASASAISIFSVVSLSFFPLEGWPERFPTEISRLMAAKEDYSPVRKACMNKEIGGDRPECNLGSSTPPEAVLWGDSHGVELAWVLGQEMGKQGRSLMQRTRGSCPPVIGFAQTRDPGCPHFNEEVLERIRKTPSIRRVYLVAYWQNGSYRVPGMTDWIDDTISRLQALGVEVFIFGPIPSQPFTVPKHLALEAANGNPASSTGLSVAVYQEVNSWFVSRFPEWRKKGVVVIDPLEVLADGPDTRIIADGLPLYFDTHHLSIAGARKVLAGAHLIAP